MYLVGQETCAACGAKVTIVTRTDGGAAARGGQPDACSECGATATSVAVWYPLEWWPEVEALAKFDTERQRLKLRPLVNESWQ